MIVQIYEVTTPAEARALGEMGVDHIGVLVGDGSFPREQTIEKAREIFAAIPAGSDQTLKRDPMIHTPKVARFSADTGSLFRANERRHAPDSTSPALRKLLIRSASARGNCAMKAWPP